MSRFGERVDEFLAELFRLNPVTATAVGNHDHDGEWPDLSEAGRDERLAFVELWRGIFEGVPGTELERDDRVDRHLLIAELLSMQFDETELREGAWDALSYVYLIGGGLFPLLAREFAPPATRLTSAASRLEGVPALLREARRELGSMPGRPPSRLHTEMAIKQLPGVASLADQAVAAAQAAAGDPAVAALEARLLQAARTAHQAIADFIAFLRDELLTRSVGEGRLGPELYAHKLRYTMRSDLTGQQILAQAWREYEAVRAEMVRIARQIWHEWLPGEPAPTAALDGSQEAADVRAVSAVCEAIGRAHHQPDELLDYARACYRDIVDFCKARNVITIPDEPLAIEWTPEFLRETATAMLDAPGPLDQGEKTYYFITPPPPEWPKEQVESYMAEENDRQVDLTTIHEGTPGHYLQLVYSNRCPSIARAVFQSGVFIEGWAVYVTQVMMDLGYKADDPALMLIHWKFYLRAITNAIIDVEIHAGSMTEEQAVELMVRGGFQEEAEARKKWDRARLTSTQLSTYYVGSMEMWRLERDARIAAAVASGDPRGAAAVPEARIVGGLGQTPGFDYKAHLESVIAHGSPPIPLIRRILLGAE